MARYAKLTDLQFPAGGLALAQMSPVSICMLKASSGQFLYMQVKPLHSC